MSGARDESEPEPTDAVLRRLATTLDHLPALAGEPREVLALEGGLTNFNFKVTTPERTAVVRRLTPSCPLTATTR